MVVAVAVLTGSKLPSWLYRFTVTGPSTDEARPVVEALVAAFGPGCAYQACCTSFRAGWDGQSVSTVAAIVAAAVPRDESAWAACLETFRAACRLPQSAYLSDRAEVGPCCFDEVVGVLEEWQSDLFERERLPSAVLSVSEPAVLRFLDEVSSTHPAAAEQGKTAQPYAGNTLLAPAVGAA